MLARLALVFVCVLPLFGQTYMITTIAGTTSGIGDGGLATDARFETVRAICVDFTGNLYIADANQVRRIDTGGVITTVIRDTRAQALTADRFGNVYAADAGTGQVKQLQPDGSVVVVAGGGQSGAEDVPATEASLWAQSLASGPDGRIYAVHAWNQLRVFTPGSNIQTIADGRFEAVATSAKGAVYVANPDGIHLVERGSLRLVFGSPEAKNLAVAPNGDIYFGNREGRLWKWTPDGATQVITTEVRDAVFTVSPQGDLYYYDGTGIQKLTASGPTRIAGGGLGDNQPPLGAAIDGADMAIDPITGDIFVSSWLKKGIRRVGRTVTTVLSDLNAYPSALAFNAAGELYFIAGNQVWKWNRNTNTTSIVAGVKGAGYNGDNIPAISAALSSPGDLAFDSTGNLYITDTLNQRIRKVSRDGVITTFAGTGVLGESPDGTLASAARLREPYSITIDASGSVWFTERIGGSPPRLRRINPSGTLATVEVPTWVENLAPDTIGGGVLASSTGWIGTGNAILRISRSGLVTQLAGRQSIPGYSGDGGPALNAVLSRPADLAGLSDGTIVFIDAGRIRKLEAANIFPLGTVNAATQRTGPIAPGELLTIYYADLPSAGLQVIFEGIGPAAIIYSDSKQINLVAPSALTGRETVNIQVVSSGRRSNTISMPIGSVSPGVFAIVDANYVRVRNVKPGEVLILFGTGAGISTPWPGDGAPQSVGTLNHSVSVRIGGIEAPIEYAGPAPGLVSGVFQINARVPSLPPSLYQLEFRVDTLLAPPVIPGGNYFLVQP